MKIKNKVGRCIPDPPPRIMTLRDPQSPPPHPQPQPHDTSHLQSQPQIPNFPQTDPPQFDKTLSLETLETSETHQITHSQKQFDPLEHSQTPIDLLEEPQKMSPRVVAAASAGVKASGTSGKRGMKRKRGNLRKLQALQQKVQILMGKLKLVPFVGIVSPDFAANEKLLRRIGLWDFVHLEFDDRSELREDLIAQLIVNYKKSLKGSEVEGVKVKLNRADLARALKLPSVVVKKGAYAGANVPVEVDDDGVDLADEKSMRFVENLMLNWMILHDGQAWMMPKEVMDQMNLVRAGRADKVAWATLVWFMVKKELSQGVNMEDCYYASHLQLLMKHQCPRIFLEESSEYVNLKGEEGEEEEDGDDVIMFDEGHVSASGSVIEECNDGKISVSVGVSEECVGEKINVSGVCAAEKVSEELEGVKTNDTNDDTETKEVNGLLETETPNSLPDLRFDCSEAKPVESSVELTLGQDDIGKENLHADEVMDVEDLDVGDTVSWQLEEKNEGEPILQQCSLASDKVLLDVEGKEEGETNKVEAVIEDLDDEEDDEEEEEDEDDEDNVYVEEEEDGLALPGKFDTLQGMPSDMYQHVTQGPFGSPLPLANGSYMQHYASQPETSSSLFGNSLSRESIRQPNMFYRTVNDGNKRLRSDGSWDHQEPSDVDSVTENIMNMVGKLRMMYAAKEKECTELEVRQQALYAELDKRDRIIDREKKTTEEVRSKSEMEIYKLERELYVMGDLLEQYKKALKESRHQFAEYRARWALPEEPLYRDAGPGGLVLSVVELERLRCRQEEEDRLKLQEATSLPENQKVEGNIELESQHRRQEEEDRLKLQEATPLPDNQKVEGNIEQPATVEGLEAAYSPLPGNQQVEENIEPKIVEGLAALSSPLPGDQKIEEDIEQPAIVEGLDLSSPISGNQKVEENVGRHDIKG